MKRSNLCMIGVVALTLAAAPVVRAQDNVTTTTTTTTDMNDMTVTGTIVSTTGDQVVITTDSGQRMTFNRGVAFTMPSGLAVGNRVTVTYGGTADNYTVNHIVVADNTAGTTSSSSYSTTNTYDSTLPRTASPVPLAGLLGALTMGAGAAVRALKSRR